MSYKVRTLSDSIKFYLPQTEGYLEIIRHIAEQYGAMSLIEFDGYFEGEFEPTKYMQVEVHVKLTLRRYICLTVKHIFHNHHRLDTAVSSNMVSEVMTAFIQVLSFGQLEHCLYY